MPRKRTAPPEAKQRKMPCAHAEPPPPVLRVPLVAAKSLPPAETVFKFCSDELIRAVETEQQSRELSYLGMLPTDMFRACILSPYLRCKPTVTRITIENNDQQTPSFFTRSMGSRRDAAYFHATPRPPPGSQIPPLPLDLCVIKVSRSGCAETIWLDVPREYQGDFNAFSARDGANLLLGDLNATQVGFFWRGFVRLSWFVLVFSERGEFLQRMTEDVVSPEESIVRIEYTPEGTSGEQACISVTKRHTISDKYQTIERACDTLEAIRLCPPVRGPLWHTAQAYAGHNGAIVYDSTEMMFNMHLMGDYTENNNILQFSRDGTHCLISRCLKLAGAAETSACMTIYSPSSDKIISTFEVDNGNGTWIRTAACFIDKDFIAAVACEPIPHMPPWPRWRRLVAYTIQ